MADDVAEHPRLQQFQPLLLAGGPARKAYLGIRSAQRLEQAPHFIWRVLQVAVHHEHVIALRIVEPGGYRDVLAEIARELNDLHARIAGGDLAALGPAATRAAVVNHHDLEPVGQFLKLLAQLAMQLLDDLRCIVHRSHDRQERPVPALHILVLLHIRHCSHLCILLVRLPC